MKLISVFALAQSILLLSACKPDNQPSATTSPQATRIDSQVTIASIEGIRTKVTVRQFLASLELCSETDPGEDLLDLIEFQDRESSVNSYTLTGGGGMGFTTRYQDGSAEEVYSLEVLEYVVTSFDYSIDGIEYIGTLKGDNYVIRKL